MSLQCPLSMSLTPPGEAKKHSCPGHKKGQVLDACFVPLCLVQFMPFSGTPKREFLFVDDMAKASLFVHNLDSKKLIGKINSMLSHINVGTGTDVTIKELAETIKEVVGFTGTLVFDRTKPDGTPRKLLDTALLKRLGFSNTISLKMGLEIAYENFTSLNGECRSKTSDV